MYFLQSLWKLNIWGPHPLELATNLDQQMQLEGPTTQRTPITQGHILGLFSRSHTNPHSSSQPWPFEAVSPGTFRVKLFEWEGHLPCVSWPSWWVHRGTHQTHESQQPVAVSSYLGQSWASDVQAAEIIFNCLFVYHLAAKYWRNTNVSLSFCHPEM